MTNKILYVARTVTGLTQSEVAEAVGIEESEYEELEEGIRTMTSEPAEKLAEFFNIDSDYFMVYAHSNMQELTGVLKKYRKLLDAQEHKEAGSGVHLAIARMRLQASIAL